MFCSLSSVVPVLALYHLSVSFYIYTIRYNVLYTYTVFSNVEYKLEIYYTVLCTFAFGLVRHTYCICSSLSLLLLINLTYCIIFLLAVGSVRLFGYKSLL